MLSAVTAAVVPMAAVKMVQQKLVSVLLEKNLHLIKKNVTVGDWLEAYCLFRQLIYVCICIVIPNSSENYVFLPQTILRETFSFWAFPDLNF